MLSEPNTILFIAKGEIIAPPVVCHVIFGSGTPVAAQVNITKSDMLRVRDSG